MEGDHRFSNRVFSKDKASLWILKVCSQDQGDVDPILLQLPFLLIIKYQ